MHAELRGRQDTSWDDQLAAFFDDASPRGSATPRRSDRPTTGGRVAAAAVALGRPLLAHQRLIVDVAGEYDPVTGLPDYGEVVVLLPRRGGKTTTTLAVFIERLRRRPDVRGFYTAQGAEDATKVLRDEWAPTIQASSLRHVDRVPLRPR